MATEPTPPPNGEKAAPDALQAAIAELRAAGAEMERLHSLNEGMEWMAATLWENYQARRAAENELLALRNSSAPPPNMWSRRAKNQLRRLAGRRGLALPPAATGVLVDPATNFPHDSRYPRWVDAYDTINDAARASIAQQLDELVDPPLISIILPVFNTPEHYLREAVASVLAQLYPNWELCIADDCSTEAWVPKVLAELEATDGRIKVTRRTENGHISASSNTAIGMANGTWICCFDHDDLLAEHALAMAVLALANRPNAGALYSDEDHVDADGSSRSDAYFKPDFDPVLLLGQNYFSHLCMLRRDLVEAVGGYREGFEGSQDWDLVLRVTELLEPRQIVHVPHVLYHWRVHPGSTSSSLEAKPYAADAGRRAVEEHLRRQGRDASVQTIGGSGFNRIRWELPDQPPLVSIIVLPRNGLRFVRCIDSIRIFSSYPALELVVMDDGGAAPPFRQYLARNQSWITVVSAEGDVSDAALRNAAARAARGEVLCFVHDDVEVLTESWLEEMVGLLLYPGIGAVGAKLFYEDDTVQHAGLVAGIGGSLGHVHRLADRLEPGYFGRAALAQCYSAVSWACMAVRRQAFESVGGFDEVHLSAAFGDADFCFRLGDAGWRTGWTPHAHLRHLEAKDLQRETEGENAVRLAREIRYLRSRWADLFRHDPAYNPNLSLAHETWPLAWPPRAPFFAREPPEVDERAGRLPPG